MKKQFFSLLLLLSFVFSISAQTQKPTETEKNLRTHVGYLASDTLAGRRTGEAGATSAAGYVANMFAKYKLKAGVSRADTKGKKSANFLQPFPYVAGVALGADNFLRIVPANPQNENKMETGVNWMPLGFSPNADIASSPIIFAGYGIVSNETKYDDYAGLDAKDNIVLVFDGVPDAGGSPHSAFGRFNIHAKAKIAQEKGARALLVISSEGDFKNDKLAQLRYSQTDGELAIPTAVLMRSHGAQLLGAKDEKELAEIEKWLAMKKDAPANIQIKLANAPTGSAQMKINLTKKQTEAYNVVGILEGTDTTLKNEAIIIGAHYDHLGRGGQGSLAVNSQEIHHGADDNASGTSAIIELARQFAKEKRNKRTLIFVAFGGEEEGLLGSKFYINNPIFPLAKTVAMINLDMVGRLKDEKLTVGGIGTAGEWKGLVESKSFQLGSATQLSATNLPPAQIVKMEGVAETAVNVAASAKTPYFNLQLNEDGFGPSDHSSFYGKQIPVLFFFTGTHEDYHKPTDTAEKINYAGLLKITNYVGEIVRSIDQNSAKPAYAVAKSSGMMGGRTGFSVSLGTVPSYSESTDGMLLDAVRDGSPAQKAGLKAGDKIVRLANRDIRNVQDYTFVLGEMKAGEEYEVVVVRGAERLTLKIVPAARK